MELPPRQRVVSQFSFILLVFGLVLAGPSTTASVSESCEGTGSAQGVCTTPAVPDTGMSLVLYGNPASSCTRRVLLALHEKGLTVS